MDGPVPLAVSTSRISKATRASSSLSMPSTLVLSCWATCSALRDSGEVSSRSNTPNSQAEKIT